MTTQHTKGPWGFKKCGCGDANCESYRINHALAQGMFVLADARLIAAAPDLLEALKYFVHETYLADCQDGHKKARAAIAKATGDQP